MFFDNFFSRYPNTDFSQINLDFLGREVQRLAKEYSTIEEVVQELKRELDNINANIDSAVRDYFADMTLTQLEQIVVGALGEVSEIAFVSSTDPDNRLSSCIVVSTLNHATIIDCGYDENGIALLQYLIDKGIDTIDAVIISHWHADHYKGITALTTQNLIDISNSVLYVPHAGLDPALITGDYTAYYNAENQWSTYWDNNCGGHVAPTEGDQVYINGIEYTFNNVDSNIYTDYNYYTYFYNENMQLPDDPSDNKTNYNNFSMIVTLRYGESYIVLPSDVEYPAEMANAYLIGKAELLQISHHGLNYLDAPEYLSSINAKYSIATAWGAGFENGFKRMRLQITRCHDTGAVYASDYETIVFGFSPLGLCAKNQAKTVSLNASPLTLGYQVMPGTDLDTLVSPGVYTVQNNEINQTLSNSPDFTSGFKLYVVRGTNGGYFQQIAITTNNIYPQIAIRNLADSGIVYPWQYLTPAHKQVSDTIGDYIANAHISVSAGNYNRLRVMNGYLHFSVCFSADEDIAEDTLLFEIPDMEYNPCAFLVSSKAGSVKVMRVTHSGGKTQIRNVSAIPGNTSFFGCVTVPKYS